jgi:predicted phage-related endonuclease
MSNLDLILAQPTVTHDLIQGSPEWDLFRLEHDGASEAAAALGLSKKVRRNDLLHAKHTGLPREFSDWLRENVLDHGHEVEALGRPHVEKRIGEALYPVTCSRGRMSASCDGLTMDDRKAFEHKQWNDQLAALVRVGIVPDEHMPQCQQVLLVTGAEELYFVVSDGTPEKMVWTKVLPDRAWWERLADGWVQFNADKAAYVMPETAPAVVATPVQALPAVLVQVSGSISIIENFRVFEAAMRDFLEHRLIRQPKTDQDFADLDLQIKAMKGAEAALDSAEAQMLAQITEVDTAVKTKAMLRKLVTDNRLMAEELLASEKERRRAEIVLKARSAYEAHIEALKADTGGPWIVLLPPDFAGKVKGLRTIASIQNAVDTELANAKIIADESARKIRAAIACIDQEGKGYEFLLRDRLGLISKPLDDIRTIIRARITEHKAVEERKAEELRAKIQREEQEKAEKAAREKIEAEQREQEAAAQRQRETEAAAARQSAPAASTAQPTATAPIAQPAVSSQAANVVSIQRPAVESTATIRLGQINELLAPIQLTVDGLATLGFKPCGKERSAVLYRETEVPRICYALVDRLHAVVQQQQAA